MNLAAPIAWWPCLAMLFPHPLMHRDGEGEVEAKRRVPLPKGGEIQRDSALSGDFSTRDRTRADGYGCL